MARLGKRAWSSPRHGHGDCAGAGCPVWARIGEWNGTRAPQRGCCSWRASSSRSTSRAPRSLAIGRETGATAAWFPAAGIGVLALLAARRPNWPATLAALTVAFTLANLTIDRPLGVSSLLGLADSVEVALVGWLIIRFIGRRLRDVNDVWRLFAIAAAGAITAGVLIASTYAVLLDLSFRTTFGLVVPSHAASMLLLAPLALLGLRSRGRTLGVRRIELLAQCVTLATATLLTLAPGHLTLGFAPLPVLVWAAVRFNAWVVVVEQVIFAVAISLLTQLGSGPFEDIVNTTAAASSTRYAQLYLICVVLIGLPLAMAMQQRERAVARLSASERMFRRNFTESRIPIALVTLRARRGPLRRLQPGHHRAAPPPGRGSPGPAGVGLLDSEELLEALRGDDHRFGTGLDRPGRRGRTATETARGDPLAPRDRRGERLPVAAHGRRHRARSSSRNASRPSATTPGR